MYINILVILKKIKLNKKNERKNKLMINYLSCDMSQDPQEVKLSWKVYLDPLFTF